MNISPRNKQIYTKIHFLRKYIYEKYSDTQVEIILGKINTKVHPEDTLPNPLVPDQLFKLRKILCGL